MGLPLKGITVLDLGWLMVGPISARYLGELGARVIKVESSKRKDPLRGLGGSATAYHMINAGKEGLAIDLSNEQGLATLKRLIKHADVLIESFTPGVIDKLGLSFEEISKINPGMVMVSTGILGRTGPLGIGTSGTGTTGSVYAGATHLLGEPGEYPLGPSGPWTDAVTPRFLVPAILSALHQRTTTGRGEYIDMAQAEAGLQFLLPAFIEHAVNNSSPGAMGCNFAPLRAPCGVYPTLGDDRWILIDASDHTMWAALVSIVGAPLNETRFEGLIGRLRAREELDAILSAWTKAQDASLLEELLQNAGVAAHIVAQDSDLSGDGDLRACGHFEKVTDPILGEFELPAPQFRFVQTPLAPRQRGPNTGDASRRILTEVGGLSDQEVDALEQAGILS